jgi:hypothetical protein
MAGQVIERVRSVTDKPIKYAGQGQLDNGALVRVAIDLYAPAKAVGNDGVDDMQAETGMALISRSVPQDRRSDDWNNPDRRRLV